MTKRSTPSPRIDRWKRRKLLRTVAVFWTPVFVLLVLLISQATRDFYYAGQFDDWWSNRQSFQRVAGLKVLGAAHVVQAQSLEREMNPEIADATIVRLDVNRSEWDAHAASIEHGFASFMDASVIEGNVFHPVKIRFRGDTSVHWLTEKRSFTLKTRRSQLWRGYRRLAFSSKNILEQLLTSQLAAEFDLLAPDTWLSPVYLNDRFYGLYRVLEQVDESFLRRCDRLPGNIYRGDAAERGEYYKGLERSLFLNPYIWDRTAQNDRPTAPPPDAIESWLQNMNGSTVADHVRFVSRLDRTEIANLLAVMLLTGDLFHMSGIHNQYWYEDPVTARLHPIPWDIELRELRKPPHQINRFLRAVFRDPFIFDQALTLLHQELVEDDLLDRAVQIVQDGYGRHQVFFEYDELRAGAVSRVGTPDVILPMQKDETNPDRLRDNIALLGEWFADAQVRWSWTSVDDSTHLIDLESQGYASADLMGIDLASQRRGDVTITYDRNRNGHLDDGDEVVAVRTESADDGIRLVFDEPIAILSGIDSSEPLIKPEPHLYRFFVRIKGDTAKSVESITPLLRNRITGEQVNPERVTIGERIAAVSSIHPWDLPRNATGTIRLSGAVHLKEDLIIEEGQTLVIESGTVIRLDPNVSIVARGIVIAEGTPDTRIAFESSVERWPWGTIALLERGADKSRFTHCVFEHGGGALWNRIEFKGMVCVHDARDVRFEHCTFRENLRCDDAVNVVSADVDLTGCRFERANADAVDYDLSTGRIERCEIVDSGNDGIDLMSCSPWIVDNKIRNSGDKGISIGEDAAPVVLGNEIRNCKRGVEVKDRSASLLAFNRIEQNGVGLLQTVKNWRYGAGGRAKLIGCQLVGNKDDIELDQASVVTIAESQIGDELVGSSNDYQGDAQAFLRARGIACESVAPLACDQRALDSPYEVILAETYREDFQSIADGWIGWRDIHKQNGALVVRSQNRDVAISKELEVAISQSAVAILELATRDIESINITVSGDRPVSRTISGTDRLKVARFVAIELSAGHYDRIELSLESAGRNARMDLRGFHIFAPHPHQLARAATP